MPVILLNHGGFYDGLLAFLRACQDSGCVGARELEGVVVAATPAAALRHLARVYGLQYSGVDDCGGGGDDDGDDDGLHRASSLMEGTR